MPRWAERARNGDSESGRVSASPSARRTCCWRLPCCRRSIGCCVSRRRRPSAWCFRRLRLLFGLKSSEETPARTPLWLLLLRLLAAALAIVALAQPSYDAAPAVKGTAPLVIFIDNGWTAAAQWDTRTAAMRRALAGAERDGRAVVIVATAEAKSRTRSAQCLDAALRKAAKIWCRARGCPTAPTPPPRSRTFISTPRRRSVAERRVGSRQCARHRRSVGQDRYACHLRRPPATAAGADAGRQRRSRLRRERRRLARRTCATATSPPSTSAAK